MPGLDELEMFAVVGKYSRRMSIALLCKRPKRVNERCAHLFVLRARRGFLNPT